MQRRRFTSLDGRQAHSAHSGGASCTCWPAHFTAAGMLMQSSGAVHAGGLDTPCPNAAPCLGPAMVAQGPPVRRGHRCNGRCTSNIAIAATAISVQAAPVGHRRLAEPVPTRRRVPNRFPPTVSRPPPLPLLAVGRSPTATTPVAAALRAGHDLSAAPNTITIAGLPTPPSARLQRLSHRQVRRGPPERSDGFRHSPQLRMPRTVPPQQPRPRHRIIGCTASRAWRGAAASRRWRRPGHPPCASASRSRP